MHLLLIDDNEDDLLLLRDALARHDRKVRISTAQSGEQALGMLHRAAGPGESARPDLVMLDINMPRLSGFDVLVAIRSHPETRTLPVVMFTTSDHPDDVRRAYREGANSFLRKPLGLTDFRDLVGKVLAYWSSTVMHHDHLSSPTS